MDEGFETSLVARIAFLVAEHLAEARGMPHLAGLKVELEQRVLRARDGALETLLCVAQLRRAARDLGDRLLFAGHVPVDADDADWPAALVAQDAAVELDVAARAVRQHRAVAMRE